MVSAFKVRIFIVLLNNKKRVLIYFFLIFSDILFAQEKDNIKSQLETFYNIQGEFISFDKGGNQLHLKCNDSVISFGVYEFNLGKNNYSDFIDSIDFWSVSNKTSIVYITYYFNYSYEKEANNLLKELRVVKK